jgi:alpha-L-fucosidase
MAREGEAAIYGSRPWRAFGEEAGGGVRYTVKGGALHALLLDPRAGPLVLAELGGEAVERVEWIGGSPLSFSRGAQGLEVSLPGGIAERTVPVLRIDGHLSGQGERG